MKCEYCDDQHDNLKICNKCAEYFKGLDETQIQNKISIIFRNLNKPKPSFIMPYGPHANKDIRELVKSAEIKEYLAHEYTKLGDCVFKLGLKQVLQPD